MEVLTTKWLKKFIKRSDEYLPELPDNQLKSDLQKLIASYRELKEQKQRLLRMIRRLENSR